MMNNVPLVSRTHFVALKTRLFQVIRHPARLEPKTKLLNSRGERGQRENFALYCSYDGLIDKKKKEIQDLQFLKPYSTMQVLYFNVADPGVKTIVHAVLHLEYVLQVNSIPASPFEPVNLYFCYFFKHMITPV